VWRSTRDSAAAVLAFIEYLKATGQREGPDRTVTVHVNGKQAGKVEFAGASKLGEAKTIEIEPDLIASGLNTVKISASSGPVYYSMSASWHVEAKKIEARTGSAEITREYFRVDRAAAASENGQYRLTPLDGQVNVGEEILVRVTVRPRSAMEYMAFEDPVPSGFEVREDPGDRYSWNYWYGRREVRDNRVAVFAHALPARGAWSFEYLMTPEHEGEYLVMPTRAWSMYYPDLAARGESTVIKVGRGQ
jgi:uncharacterized protein YfaS (alpha-2-macroglobulin family)